MGGLCTPIPLRSSSTYLECTTPEFGGSGKYALLSFGFEATCGVSGGCFFTYSYDATPVVTSALPEWVAQPGTIAFGGGGFTLVHQTAAHSDFRVRLGHSEQYVCDIGDNALSWSSFACNVASMEAGALDVTVALGRGAAIEPRPLQVSVLPTIDRVTPSSGSTGGGLLVTLYGFGFSAQRSGNAVAIRPVRGRGDHEPLPDVRDVAAREHGQRRSAARAGPRGAERAGRVLDGAWQRRHPVDAVPARVVHGAVVLAPRGVV